MRLKLCTLAAVSVGMAAAAHAAPIASKDDCYARAFQLADKLNKAKLPEATKGNIEGMLVKLESECVSGALDKAATSAEAIETAISAK
jgi:hypothetical protein